MSNLIRFLETLGQNAELRHAATPAIYKALNEQRIEPEAQWAVLRGDQAKLNSLAGSATPMGCVMLAPEMHLVEATMDTEVLWAKVG
jgi:hypothetical protein